MNYCLFYKKDYHESYDYLYPEFKKMFLENLYVNTLFYGLLDKTKQFKSLQKVHDLLKNKDLRDEEDLKEIEDFFIKVINNRKDNLHYAFIPYKEVINDDVVFYMEQLNWIYQDYYKDED